MSAQYPRADVNGYISQYDEPVILQTDSCKPGRTCHKLPNSCDVVFNPSMSRSAIEGELRRNNGNSVFCFEAGDYGSLGNTLNLRGGNTSCTSSNPCWLILEDAVTKQNLTPPWKRSRNAVFNDEWSCNDANWVISHLKWKGSGNKGIMFNTESGCDNLTVNAVEVTNWNGTGVSSNFELNSGADNVVIQQLFCHDHPAIYDEEVNCVRMRGAKNARIVNSEMFNVAKGIYCFDECPGLVIENNDIYATPDFYTDCHGNAGDKCSKMKTPISLKQAGTADNIVRILHNRIWGSRRTANEVCCTSTGDGSGVTWSNNGSGKPSAEYALLKDNIFFDSNVGISVTRNGPTRNSAVGNIFYKIMDVQDDGTPGWSHAITLARGKNSEAYLNTFVYVANGIRVSSPGHDVRCNAFIMSGDSVWNPDYASEADYNAFYGTKRFGSENPSHDIDRSDMNRWKRNSDYDANATVYPSEKNGYIYTVVEDNGLSGSAEPNWCKSLGCKTKDGEITWQAVRGPYFFYRKLLSASEKIRIPYANVHSSAPEYEYCPGEGRPNALGSRYGIGVDDT